MGDYTKLQLDKAREIIALYGLGKLEKLTPLSLGISNSNYKVRVQKRPYLLKVSNDKGKEQLIEEQKILLYLQKCGYRYSLCPITLSNGDLVYEYGEYFGVLYPFIEGISPGPSDTTCFEIGKALGELHALGHNDDKIKSLRNHQDVGFGPQEILDYTHNQACPQKFKDAFTSLFPDKLKAFLSQDFKKGIIHGDLYYDNTLFFNNNIAAVLDFEQSGIGEYILDLGISISGSCLEKGHLSLPLIKSYIKGYESVRPLPENESLYLLESILLGLFSIARWRIKRFKEGTLNPAMAESYKDLLYKALNFAEHTNTDFLYEKN